MKMDLPNVVPSTPEQELLKGSHFEGSMDAWKEHRGFIAEAIDRDGTILDIGCANGLLLKSLQEWSEHSLEPYGVDTDPDMIAKSKQLFPEKTENFLTLDGTKSETFPKKFDLVFWNVWDNADFSEPKIREIFNSAVKMSVQNGGRLILGFYDRDPKDIEKKIAQLKQEGWKMNVIAPDNITERAVFIDEMPETP